MSTSTSRLSEAEEEPEARTLTFHWELHQTAAAIVVWFHLFS